jgi:hypothetical protein
MIPASYHFKDIYRDASMHPGVEAEIAAARARDGIEYHAPLKVLAVVLRRLVPAQQLRYDWSRIPAE